QVERPGDPIDPVDELVDPRHGRLLSQFVRAPTIVTRRRLATPLALSGERQGLRTRDVALALSLARPAVRGRASAYATTARVQASVRRMPSSRSTSAAQPSTS